MSTVTLAALQRRVAELESSGWVALGVWPDGRGGTRPYDGSTLTVLEVAILNHVRRPFLTRALASLRAEISTEQARLVARVWSGRVSPERAGIQLGTWLERTVRAWLWEHGPVIWPNSPEVAAAKDGKPPLYDTGELFAAIEARTGGATR